MIRIKGRWTEWVIRLVAPVALFLATRAFVVEMFKIPTPSMQGTLMVGDFLVVEKLGYTAEVPMTHALLPGVRHPERGEVIVFRWPSDPTVNFVKRVIGVPGDTLLMRDGALRRNGSVVSEPYVSHVSPGTDLSAEAFRWQRDYLVSSLHATQRDKASYWPSRNNWGPIVVPQKSYFVLGDNRDNSLDSRYWGFVPDSLVRGRPRIVYFSYEPDSTSRFSWLTRLRWSRIGTVVR